MWEQWKRWKHLVRHIYVRFFPPFSFHLKPQPWSCLRDGPVPSDCDFTNVVFMQMPVFFSSNETSAMLAALPSVTICRKITSYTSRHFWVPLLPWWCSGECVRSKDILLSLQVKGVMLFSPSDALCKQHNREKEFTVLSLCAIITFSCNKKHN